MDFLHHFLLVIKMDYFQIFIHCNHSWTFPNIEICVSKRSKNLIHEECHLGIKYRGENFEIWSRSSCSVKPLTTDITRLGPRPYTQLPHSALGFTLHLGTSNKPSSLPFWELMILHQSLANIVPSHLSHSLVCVALSIDNVMGFILILLSVVD